MRKLRVLMDRMSPITATLAATVRRYTESEMELMIRTSQDHSEVMNEFKIDPDYVFPDSGNSILHLCGKSDNTDLAIKMMFGGCNVNIQNKIGNTALIDAVLQENSLSYVDFLLVFKSDYSLCNANGDSALKLALKSIDSSKKLAIMKLFMREIRQITRKPSFKPSFKPIRRNTEEIVRLLTEANCSLTCAVYLNDIDVIKLMLLQGCPTNGHIIHNRWTALHVAAMISDYEMVKLLVENGCDVNTLDQFGFPPLHYYIVNHKNEAQCTKTISTLLPTNINWTDVDNMKLYSIFVWGTKETLRLFLQTYDVRLTARDEEGMTPLHYLTSNENDGIFDLFQNVDLDVNICDKKYKITALHCAAFRGNVTAVKFLLSRGANIDVVDSRGLTPIFFALARETIREKDYRSDYRDCSEILAQHGADLQVIADDEMTLYKKASNYQIYYLVEPMIAHLARNEAAGKPIRQQILDQINSDINLQRRYIACKQELAAMRTQTVYGTVTLLKFLIEKETKVALYTREKESFDRVMSAYPLKDSYYFTLLRKRFDRAMKIDELRCKTALILNETIEQLEMNHVIVNRILDFFSYDETLKFD